MLRSSNSVGIGPVIDSQDWLFETATGEHLELHVKYEHGVGNKGNAGETKFYSAKDPGIVQISRQEQVLDIVRNVTTNPPDRVKEYTFKASGGRYSKLFDGSQQTLSWDNVVWITRSVMVP
jgi:hypothetical protein